MANIKVLGKNGSEIKDLELSSDIFESKINGRMLELVTRLYANNKRTGTAHTKTRAEVSGGGSKPWRQKGTGRARVSSIRSPLWRGGGTVFGPRKRVIYNIIPKQIRRKALISAVSKKFREEAIKVLDDFNFETSKTKELFVVLKNLSIDGKKVLMVAENPSEMLVRVSRNIKNLKLVRAQDVNAYNVLRKAVIFADEASIKAIENRLLNIAEEANATADE